MSSIESSRSDKMFASVFSWSSQNLKRFPWLDERIVGPNLVPEGWHRLPKRALMTEPHWTTVSGDPKGPRLPIPSRYRRASVLAINKAQMDSAHLNYEDGRDALLLQFGGELVVGAMAEGAHFADMRGPFNVNKLLVALRSARGDQPVVGGVFSPSQLAFNPAITELNHVYSVREVPAAIPIL